MALRRKLNSLAAIQNYKIRFFRLSGLGGMKPNTLVLTIDDAYRFEIMMTNYEFKYFIVI